LCSHDWDVEEDAWDVVVVVAAAAAAAVAVVVAVDDDNEQEDKNDDEEDVEDDDDDEEAKSVEPARCGCTQMLQGVPGGRTSNVNWSCHKAKSGTMNIYVTHTHNIYVTHTQST
jgi:hypothetical protein